MRSVRLCWTDWVSGKRALALGLIGIGVTAVTVVSGCRPAGTSYHIDKQQLLARYYPANTYALLEAAPSQAQLQFFLGWLSKESAASGKIPDASNASNGASAEQVPIGEARQAILQSLAGRFERYFKPHFSVGRWQQIQPSGGSPSSEHVLAIMPLQNPRLSLQALEAALYDRPDLQRHTRVRTPAKGSLPPILEDRTAWLSFEIEDGNLWISDSASVLQTVSSDNHPHLKKHRVAQRLLDLPEVVKAVALLPNQRHAYFILQPGRTERASAKTPQTLEGFQRAIGRVMPVTTGSLRFEQDTLTTAELRTPLVLEGASPGERALYLDWMNHPVTFQAARLAPSETNLLVSFGGLDRLIRLFTDCYAPADQRSLIGTGRSVMQLVGLDLDQDIFGLFSDELSLAMSLKPQGPMDRCALSAAPAPPSPQCLNDALKQPEQTVTSAMALMSRTPARTQTIERLVDLVQKIVPDAPLSTDTLGNDTTAWMFSLAHTAAKSKGSGGDLARTVPKSLARLALAPVGPSAPTGQQMFVLSSPEILSGMIRDALPERHALQTSEAFQSLAPHQFVSGLGMLYLRLPSPAPTASGAQLQAIGVSFAPSANKEVIEGRLAIRHTPLKVAFQAKGPH